MRHLIGVGVWRAARLISCTSTVIALVSGCSTPLLNSNTLELAGTVDDITVRQVIFNLAKTAENAYALPAQVQIPSGQVSARTSIAPNIATPFDTALTSTSEVISQVAASGGVTTTAMNTGADQRVASTAGVSGLLQDTENWNVYPVQDPEQLRRLQLLYQYGAHQIDAGYVLCHYPIPELPERTTSTNSVRNPDAPSSARRMRYIRGEFPGACNNIALETIAPVKWMFVGPSPDPAFLKPPSCILCAFPNTKFQSTIKEGDPIYPDRYSNVEVKKADPRKYLYVPVVLNDFLIPGKPLQYDYHDYQHRTGKIDWLYVLPDGGDRSPPEHAKRVGSSRGYTVYTIDERRFSEFVLAVVEATLQPHELEKQGAVPPPVVQTNPH
jgi:hypothetical protein